MRHRHALLVILAALLPACSDEPGATAPPPPPPAPAVPLRDVEIRNLPSPYYHFEYDSAGRVRTVSFASGLTTYDVTYVGNRISEMRNNTIANHDRLAYAYDDAGRVATVAYSDANGRVYTRVFLSYDGQRLVGLRRERNVGGVFVVDKVMSLSYDADGNARDVTVHRPAIDGVQPTATTTVDHFEQYDHAVNVDGFGLIHDDFFDHLVLLPGVRLQNGNPARETRTGDGLNYRVEYRYTYDDARRPLTKTGDATLTNGSDAGRRFETSSVFSYY
jgi:hypothetical protein